MSTFALDSYRLLGPTGLRVSPLCLGTMTFGTDWGWGADKDASRAMFNAYADKGGNFIDTANRYTNGVSEEYVGEFAAERESDGGRERFVIATKYTLSMRPKDPNAGGNHRKNIMRACEASLRRLNTDYIDLYWVHMWDYRSPAEEVMRAFDDLVAQGKVLYCGASDTPAYKVAECNTLAKLRGWSPFIALQIEYSLIERTVEAELMLLARDYGLGVTPWSPLAGGILSGKYNLGGGDGAGTRQERMDGVLSKPGGERKLAIAAEVIKVAEELGFDSGKERGAGQSCTPSQVALAWLLRQRGVTSPIIGARTPAQCEDNLAALALAADGSALTDAHMERLSEASKPEPTFPTRFLGQISAILDGENSIETRWP